jgi:pyrimidine-nucleoside phosphorylase
MNEPLGRCIGTGIEVAEAREMLRGDAGDERARSGCVQIAAAMLELGGVDDARAAAVRALEDGSAYAKFVEMVEAQGGSREALEALAPDSRVTKLRASTEGVVVAIDAVRLGHVARELSAHNRRAGIRLDARIGDRIARGDVLADIYGAGADPDSIAEAFTIGAVSPAARPLVYATI